MKVVPLGDALVDVRTGPFGSLLHKSDYVQGGVPLVNPMHIVDEQIVADTDFSVSDEKIAELRRYILEPGHIVMGRRGEMGRCAVVREAHGEMICGTGSMILIPNKAILDPDYAVRLLRTPKARQFLENAASGVTMLNLNPSAVKGLPIPLPPLEEQKRIAAILDQADALRRLRARALDRLGALGQAIFHEMFGDVRSNSRKLPMPEFGDFAEVKLGKMLDRGKSNGADQFPYLRNANVRWFDFDLSDLSLMEFAPSEFTRFSVMAGDLMICEGGEPGRCAVWRDESREIFYQKALHRARLDPRKALPDYVAQWFAAAAGVGAFDEAVTVATISHLTGEKIKALKIMLPPLSEQHAFNERLQSVKASAAITAHHADRTHTLFTSLQHRAFRGEL